MYSLLFLTAMLGQCPGGICPLILPTVEAAHGWYAGAGDKIDLYWKGERVGALDPKSSEWLTEGKALPVNLRATFAKAEVDTPYFGVDWDRIKAGNDESYKIRGAEVPASEVYAALGGDANVPDDGKTARLVVLGSVEARRQLLDDWSKSPLLSAFKSKLIVQAYPPEHWHVSEVGYKALGDPTIYLVDSAGKAKHLQSDYDGPAQLAAALRQVDPSFDPVKVPDLRKGGPGSNGLPLNANHCCLGGLLVLATAAGMKAYLQRKG